MKKLGCRIEALKRIVVWGNHSLITFPDLAYSACDEKPILEVPCLFCLFCRMASIIIIIIFSIDSKQ